MTDEMESVKNQISELEGTLNNLCTKLSEQRKSCKEAGSSCKTGFGWS